MERDHKGFLQYVNRNIVNGTVIEKYSALNGEELVFPRRELCLKFCALSPPRPVGQFFNGQEARCPDNIRYAGLAAYDWRSVLADDSRPSSPVLSPAALRKSWEFFSTGQKQSRIAKSIDDLNNNYKSADRVCVPLETRYEPMAFIRRRRGQRNLYYRFEYVPLGDRRCCCYKPIAHYY